MYAQWGIDYLKYDLCSFIPDVMEKQAPNDKAEQMRLMIAAYDKMGKALKATGRPIVFSLCQYGWDAVWEWAPALGGNLWRTTGDITPHWDRIYAIVSQQSGLESYAGPGHWNDPDMLEVGNGKLSLAENRTHFTLWAMLAAPLLAGNDLPHMKPEIKAILTNRDVIAIDQDPLGQPGRSRLLRRRGRGLDPPAPGRSHRRSHRRRRRQPLLQPPLPPQPGQARPPRPASRQRPMDRQAHHPHRQAAHRDRKPRRAARPHRHAAVRASQLHRALPGPTNPDRGTRQGVIDWGTSTARTKPCPNAIRTCAKFL